MTTSTALPALAALPTYDLGPGRSGDELVVNVIIYSVVLTALLALAWIGWLIVRAVIEERPARPAPRRHDEIESAAAE